MQRKKKAAILSAILLISLINDMPFWNIDNVNFKNNKLVLDKVSGKGSIDFSDIFILLFR